MQTSYDASEDVNFPADAKKPSHKDQEGDLLFPDEVCFCLPYSLPFVLTHIQFLTLKSIPVDPDPKKPLKYVDPN